MRGFASAMILAAALAAGSAAAACDETILLEYTVEGGRYQFDVNGVYLDSGRSQFASGGAPIKEWLLEGENIIGVQVDADTAQFTLYSICDDGSRRQDLYQSSLQGRSSAELRFTVDAPPPRIYLSAEPTTAEGLLDAVADLQAAFSARDFDRVWALHAAMRADMELAGQPMKAAAYEMGKIVEHIAPEFAPELRAFPVLGGRVWEVYGEGFAPPISDVVAVNGGEVKFQTGTFWMRRNGAWSVLEK